MPQVSTEDPPLRAHKFILTSLISVDYHFTKKNKNKVEKIVKYVQHKKRHYNLFEKIISFNFHFINKYIS